MLVNNDVSQAGARNFEPHYTNNKGQAAPPLGWKELKPTSRSKGKRRRRILAIASAVLLISLIFTVLRVASIASGNNDQLTLTVGSQQGALLDLRQSLPISPYLYGVNVFPPAGSSSIEANFTGFMNYGSTVVNSLHSAGINLLRFPGGSWGENHILSYDQLYDFSNLLYTTGAQGMIQARLSNPIDKYNKATTLDDRARLAGHWVDFMSNPKSTFRGKYARVPIHPVLLWSVGNEPDRLTDPDTGAKFLVGNYVKDFIAYSLQMHQNNPTIKVFGPEISQFYGIGSGPTDINGTPWMEGFLKGVAAYEKAHNLPFHLLDGVSFHTYPLLDAHTSPYLLMSSSEEWNYLLPQLRQFTRQTMGRDLPIAITEINSTPSNGQQPTKGQAALWWADTLGTLMNQQAEYVSFFSAQGVEPPYPLLTGDNSPQQTAMYRVFQLYSHLQHNLLPLQVQHDPVDAFATVDDAHQALSLLFVNKSGVNQVAQVSPQNQLFGFSPWHTQQISIAAYSVVLVTMHRGGGAEAYSFSVPAADTTNINPLQQTVCGQKTDALAYTIPC